MLVQKLGIFGLLVSANNKRKTWEEGKFLSIHTTGSCPCNPCSASRSNLLHFVRYLRNREGNICMTITLAIVLLLVLHHKQRPHLPSYSLMDWHCKALFLDSALFLSLSSNWFSMSHAFQCGRQHSSPSPTKRNFQSKLPSHSLFDGLQSFVPQLSCPHHITLFHLILISCALSFNGAGNIHSSPQTN